MSQPRINAETRQLFGRKVKQLRKQNLTPANIFGKKIKSMAIQIDQKILQQAYDQYGETTVIDLVIKSDQSSHPVLITNVQTHPVTDQIIHVDFHQVDLTEKVVATVPLVLQGTAPVVAETGATILLALNEIEVEALPNNIPSEIQVDISNLKTLEDTILIKDLKIDTEKVTLKADPEQSVINIEEVKAEEEPEVEPEAIEEASVGESETKTESSEDPTTNS